MRYVVIGLVVLVTAMVLSHLWRVPYIYTLLGFSTWAFLGHLVTADDDMSGGWSNPNGERSFPWPEIAAKAFVLSVLALAAVLSPSLRGFGT